MCVDIRMSAFGGDHPAVASALYRLGQSYGALDERETAVELLTESLGILLADAKNPGSEVTPDDLKKVWSELGKIQEALGRYEDAQSSFQARVEIDQEQTATEEPRLEVENNGHSHNHIPQLADENCTH